MYVCITVQNLPIEKDRRTWAQAKTLREAGCTVAIVCQEGQGDEGATDFEPVEGIHIHRYPAPPAAHGVAGFLVEFVYCFLRTSAVVVRLARSRRIDVLQLCNPPDTYWPLAWLLKRWMGTRVVFDQHDLCPEVYASRFDPPSRLLVAALEWLERRTYQLSDHVIVVNESFRRMATTRGGKRFEDTTVSRVAPDPDRTRVVPPVPELRRGRRYLLLYVGVMAPQDNVDLAVRAVDHLVHELGRTDVTAALLGSGDSYESIRDLVEELGLADHVVMTGWADDETMNEYLSTASVGLCPEAPGPLNNLATFNKVLDYMAFGLPMVSFDLPETRVTAGEASVYVEGGNVAAFAKAIVALLEDEDERRKRGLLGRQRLDESLALRFQLDAYRAVFGLPPIEVPVTPTATVHQ